MARSKPLASNVGRLSRSQVFAKRGLFKGQKTAPAPAAEAKPETFTKEVKGDKNGSSRVVPVAKASRFYPAEDVALPKKSRKVARQTKIRGSITPGTVLILLAGRFRGKRVVFLKQLASGLLLVTGPFKINGVPLRRVNQAYVIATSTKVDLSGVSIDAKFDDEYFAKEKSKAASKEEEFFGTEGEKKAYPESKGADQKSLDKEIIAAASKVEGLPKYLAASFGLSRGEFPHALKF